MNIFFISREYPWRKPYGGVGVYTSAISAALARKGNQVTVVTQSPDSSIRKEQVHGIDIIGLPWPDFGPFRNLFSYSLVEAHIWSQKATDYIKTKGMPFDVIEAPSMNGEGLSLQRQGQPVVVRIHGGAVINLASKEAAKWHHRWLYKREQQTLQRAYGLTAVSRIAARHIGDFYNTDTSKATIIPNPVDTDQFYPGSKLPHNKLLFAGHLNEVKGFDLLPDIMNQIWINAPDTYLTIAGEKQNIRTTKESSTAYFMSRIPSEKHSLVTFQGVVKAEDMPDLYRQHGLLIAPSRRDTFSMVAAEALACGLPVIGTRKTGMIEVIEDGQTGYLVEQQNTHAIAKAALDLLLHKEKSRGMGKNARQHAVSAFSFNSIATVMQDFYTDYQNKHIHSE